MKSSAALVFCAMLALGADARVAAATHKTELKKSIPEIDNSLQLILVTTRDWNSVPATVRYFERADAKSRWKEMLPLCAAVTGKNGMAWGIGLHGASPGGGLVKQEGDNRAPAGVFRLNEIFGFTSPAAARITKFPYEQLTASSEGVDDARSHYYNRVVDATRIADRDWKSSEAMVRPCGLYRWGVIVEHNWKAVPGYGSCIFLHIWLGPGHGTSGCTAMALPDLLAIIRRLDATKHPLLVQLPVAEYQRLKTGWGLP